MANFGQFRYPRNTVSSPKQDAGAHWTIILKRFILAPFLGALRPRSRSACENPLFTFYFLFFVLRVLCFLTGFQISAYQPADSGTRLLEHQRFGGRRLQDLYCRRSSAMAFGYYTLAH